MAFKAKNPLFNWPHPAIILTSLVLVLNLSLGWADDISDLQAQAAQMKLNFEKLNQSNPLYKQTQPNTNPPEPNSGEMIPDPAFEKLTNIIQNPMVQGYVKTISNPVFANQLSLVIKNPNRQLIFFAEICTFIFFLMFRSWAAARINHWFIGLVVRMTTNLVYMVVCGALIPWIFIGDPYFKILTALFQSTAGVGK